MIGPPCYLLLLVPLKSSEGFQHFGMLIDLGSWPLFFVPFIVPLHLSFFSFFPPLEKSGRTLPPIGLWL
jgi:hypothetical protein